MFSYRMTLAAALVCCFAAAPVVSAQDQAAMGTFNGSLRGTSLTGSSDATRFSGSVDIKPSSNGKAGNFNVAIRVSAGGWDSHASSTGMLMWSISPGRCGSRIQYLVQPSEMPQVEMRTGGNGELTWDGPVNLAAGSSYQLVIYDNGMAQQNIVACANLKYSAPKSK